MIRRDHIFLPLSALLSIAARSGCVEEYECDVDAACSDAGLLGSGATGLTRTSGSAVVLSAAATVVAGLLAFAFGAAA